MADEMDVLRSELRAVLAANAARLCDGLRAELARPHTLEPGRVLQFEADPWSWGITSTATEEPIFDGDLLSDSLGDWFERCEASDINWDALLSDEICPWFAECRQAVGGPARFSPAYLFLHGYHQRQFDLELRNWVTDSAGFA